MLFELFKNSMRAVMEHRGTDADTYPALEVTIAQGKEDICVKVRKYCSNLKEISHLRENNSETIDDFLIFSDV